MSRDVVDFHGILTQSPAMRALFDLIERIARTPSSVLIRGESGTGKELVAAALHALSPRAAGAFRSVNCATFTPELLASELFGHVRGAFTGAIRDRKGLFELADGGTVFLDEIAEMSLDVQARVLRVLQERSFVPVGGSEPVSVDVRLVSATNKALRAEVKAGRFREDLMYRVRVVPIFLPRLADREGDVDALVDRFVAEFNARGLRQVEKVSPDALEALRDYDWPGNVRELRNAIEYSFAVGEGPTIACGELPPELRGEPPPGGELDELVAYDEERARLEKALTAARGRKARAAELLGISRSTLWRKLREHRLA
jgi:transcriptional regulator with PAS, ATPase and Fis domain